MQRRWTTVTSWTAALTLGVGTLAACGQEAPEPGEDVTVADVAGAELDAGDGETAWIERPVTVTGQVVQVLDPGAFLMGDPGVLEPSVLVLSPQTDFTELGLDITDLVVEDETTVEVSGTVRRLSLGEFQEDYEIPYDENVFEEYAGDAVIVADRLVATTAD
ncbi:hypothetical protein GXB85_02700 [Cellulomonas sp. APG4]|uniref:hypothetical protein n=1 Tax=Cellulomonas sp. APG4 TaxID=1538656 RepID=UPI00137B0189|nr:hypothetical protein [Cellulomonas sp. APG4]NCT89867.1 hypothetical protein [Cellulomonas sp. APG4]